MPKTTKPARGANPAYASAARALRASGAAGPHHNTVPRAERERQALDQQQEGVDVRLGASSAGRRLFDDGVRLFVVLDFDGVINAFPSVSPGQGGPAYDDFEMFTQQVKVGGMLQAYRITWSPVMIATLNAVLDDHRVQLCWLTSWRGLVLKPARRMGLAGARPPVIVPHGNSWDPSGQTGKPEGLVAFLGGVPASAGVVWCDDNLNERVSNWQPYIGWEKQVGDQVSPQYLPVGPCEETGISKTEMGRIVEFAASVLGLCDLNPRMGADPVGR